MLLCTVDNLSQIGATNKVLESWILRPFLGFWYCFHGHFWETRDSITHGKKTFWSNSNCATFRFNVLLFYANSLDDNKVSEPTKGSTIDFLASNKNRQFIRANECLACTPCALGQCILPLLGFASKNISVLINCLALNHPLITTNSLGILSLGSDFQKHGLALYAWSTLDLFLLNTLYDQCILYEGGVSIGLRWGRRRRSESFWWPRGWFTSSAIYNFRKSSWY